MPNVGPAMLHDTDDPAAMRLLAQALSTLPHLNASAIIADDNGIHWKTIRESAKLVRYVTDHSPRSQGNFQFTATAMLKPLSARLQPVSGKKAGDMTEFESQYLFNTRLH
jgi:hypothetical protein